MFSQVRPPEKDSRLAPAEPGPQGLRLLRASLPGREPPPRRDGAGHGVHRQEDRRRHDHEERSRHGGQPQPGHWASQVNNKPLNVEMQFCTLFDQQIFIPWDQVYITQI